MRELTLIETGWLCAGLLLCLVLPLMLSAYAPQHEETRKSGLKIVWTGQILLGLAGLLVFFTNAAAPFVFSIAFVGYLGCAFVLHRQLRAAKLV